MADFTALKTAIQNAIKQNGNEEITGNILQEVMLAVVSTLGDGAINDLIAALSTEVTNRQNADGTLQSNLNAEQSARQLADSTLQSGINNERDLRVAADNALSNRITAITDAIDNGYVYAGIATTSTEPVTGKVFYLTTATGVFTNFGGITDNTKGIKILKKVDSTWTSDTVIVMDDTPTENSTNLVKSGGVYASIASVLSKIAEGYLYVGIATTLTNPSTPSGKVFYIAVAAGTYTNFLDSSSQPLVLTQGINILKYNGTSWSVEQVWGVDDAPTPSSNNLVKSGGVFNDIMTNGSAFDLSAYNNGTTYADLNAALTALNVLPAAYKKGGMSFKYVQTSDNKYVQYMYLGTATTGNPNPFLNTANWQKVNLEKELNQLGADVDSILIDNAIFDTENDLELVQKKFKPATKEYEDDATRVSSKIVNAEGKHFRIKSNEGINFYIYISYDGDTFSLLTDPDSTFGNNVIAEINGVKSFVLMAFKTGNLPISVNEVYFSQIKSEYTNIIDFKQTKNDTALLYDKKNYKKLNLYFYPMNFDRATGYYKNINQKNRWATDKIEVSANDTICIKTEASILMSYSTDNGQTWSQWMSPIDGVLEYTFGSNSLVVFVLSKSNANFEGNEEIVNQCDYNKGDICVDDLDGNLEYSLGVEYDYIRDFNFKGRNYDFTNHTYKEIGSRSRSASDIIDISNKRIALLQKNTAILMLYYTSDDGITWESSGYVYAGTVYKVSGKNYLLCIASSNPINNNFNPSSIELVSLKYGELSIQEDCDDSINTNNVVAEGFWITPTDTSGRITKITNPYKKQYGKQFMGELHCHSYYWNETTYGPTRTKENAEIVYNLYKVHGYDFLTITNYPYCGGLTPDPIENGGLVWLCNSYEGAVSTQANGVAKRSGTHLLFLNAEKIYSDATITNKTANEMIEQAIEDGVVPVLAHPMWARQDGVDTLYASEELLALPDNLKFIEIYNTVSQSFIETPYSQNSAYGLDVLASDGRIVWGLGVSDSHNFKLPNNTVIDTEQVEGGNIKVFAKHRSASAIWESIMQGNYYSCSHYLASLKSVELINNKLIIDIGDSGATTKFYGKNGALLQQVTGAIAEYEIVGNELYVRAEITTSQGYKMWTNPIYLFEEN